MSNGNVSSGIGEAISRVTNVTTNSENDYLLYSENVFMPATEAAIEGKIIIRINLEGRIDKIFELIKSLVSITITDTQELIGFKFNEEARYLYKCNL